MKILAVAIGVAALAGASGAEASSRRLAGALAAAFGPGRPVRHVVNPATGPELPRDLTVEAAALAPLGGSRYALVVREVEELGAHVTSGAVGVAYLRRTKAGWRTESVWPEVAWTGNSGDPGAVSIRRDLGPDPVATTTSEYIAQGEHDIATDLIVLGRSRPTHLGSIPTGGFLEPWACSVCKLYRFGGRLSADGEARGSISVTYRGWTSPPGSKVRRPFDARTAMRARNGRFTAASDLQLPTGKLSELIGD